MPADDATGGIPADTETEYAAKLARAVTVVTGWLRHLIDPDQVVELRALKMHDGTQAARDGKGGYTAAGTFRGHEELELMAREALLLSGCCQGVYYTLNPLHPERYDRRAPRVRRAGHGELAEDRDVITRRWLLVDVDPVRAAGHAKDSTTDAEKAAAWEIVRAVREYVAGEGWPAPVVSDSGNGYHLLYKLAGEEGCKPAALPTPDSDPVRRFLLHLADRFDGPAANIDTVTFNPGRIVKFPGTLACKGVGTADRPHRRAKVLEIPE